MYKKKLVYQEAYDHVQKYRKGIYPNVGFQEQLRLYEEMNYLLDITHPKYLELLEIQNKRKQGILYLYLFR